MMTSKIPTFVGIKNDLTDYSYGDVVYCPSTNDISCYVGGDTWVSLGDVDTVIEPVEYNRHPHNCINCHLCIVIYVSTVALNIRRHYG